jgi:hypothetical protein
MPRWTLSRVGDALHGETPGYIRHVGSTAPADTSEWGVRDLWADTSDEATTGIVLRRWDGDSFVPAP